MVCATEATIGRHLSRPSYSSIKGKQIIFDCIFFWSQFLIANFWLQIIQILIIPFLGDRVKQQQSKFFTIIPDEPFDEPSSYRF